MVSPSWGTGRGEYPRYQKNAAPQVTALFYPKNVDFVIFMQFLAILTQSQMSQIMARDAEKAFHILQLEYPITFV